MQPLFYSNGKLLITAEYGVLDGALALAIPTPFGQSLEIRFTNRNVLLWESVDHKGNIWFTASYNTKTFDIQAYSDRELAETLAHLLRKTKEMNPNFISENTGCKIITKLTFPRNWGLGSSSTLINNLAMWAGIDPYELLKDTFGGSGYDIACAQYDVPILYQLKDCKAVIEETTFNPPFRNQLYFVFLNQKQNSREAIANYRKQDFDSDVLVRELSSLTLNFLESKDLSEFEFLMRKHEKLLSKVLGVQPVKKRLFPDYSGAIKSLGGWGGDFILVTGNEKTPSYFSAKGFDVVIPFDEMILENKESINNS